jgi:Mn2+/Fe2+ NRAMP family transporter
VVLSLQLPFAAIPLVLFYSRPKLMGPLNPPL